MEAKRYRCGTSNFAFPIVKDGKQRWLRFLGAKANEGFYTTSDEAEQRVIEGSKRFRRGEITLVGTYAIDENSELTDELSVINGSTPTPVDDAVVKEVVEVGSVQAAREWLIANKGVKASELPNKDAILACAGKLSVEFRFES